MKILLDTIYKALIFVSIYMIQAQFWKQHKIRPFEGFLKARQIREEIINYLILIVGISVKTLGADYSYEFKNILKFQILG